MARDERGRFVLGTAPGPGRPAGVMEVRPRQRPVSVRVVTAGHIRPLTMNRLDRRTVAGRTIAERVDELLHDLRQRNEMPFLIKLAVCRQIAYLEFRLSMMQASELLADSSGLDSVLRAMRELRAWYSFALNPPRPEFDCKPLLDAIVGLERLKERR